MNTTVRVSRHPAEVIAFILLSIIFCGTGPDYGCTLNRKEMLDN